MRWNRARARGNSTHPPAGESHTRASGSGELCGAVQQRGGGEVGDEPEWEGKAQGHQPGRAEDGQGIDAEGGHHRVCQVVQRGDHGGAEGDRGDEYLDGGLHQTAADDREEQVADAPPGPVDGRENREAHQCRDPEDRVAERHDVEAPGDDLDELVDRFEQEQVELAVAHQFRGLEQGAEGDHVEGVRGQPHPDEQADLLESPAADHAEAVQEERDERHLDALVGEAADEADEQVGAILSLGPHGGALERPPRRKGAG